MMLCLRPSLLVGGQSVCRLAERKNDLGKFKESMRRKRNVVIVAGFKRHRYIKRIPKERTKTLCPTSPRVFASFRKGRSYSCFNFWCLKN